MQFAGMRGGELIISRSGEKCQGSRGRAGGKWRSCPPLHGGLAAEDNLQVLAVELPRLSQGHDTLFVVGELLDIHFLGDTGRG